MNLRRYLLLFILFCKSPLIYTGMPWGPIVERPDPYQKYRINLELLTPELRRFVEDYATWPRKEKNKIRVGMPSRPNDACVAVISEPVASSMYGGDIEQYLHERLTELAQKKAFVITVLYLYSIKNEKKEPSKAEELHRLFNQPQ